MLCCSRAIAIAFRPSKPVKREGVLTALWHGSRSPQTRPSRELIEACDERRELTEGVVASILRG